MFLSLLMVVSLYRAIFGPTVLDRMIGANAIGSKTVVLLILIGFLYRRTGGLQVLSEAQGLA